MSATAFQTQFRQETIKTFEHRETLVRKTVTTEHQMKGSAAVFLVSGSGSASAVTRGVNGLIPARTNDHTQNTCTLVEWHDLARSTGFNIFASQGNQRQVMQDEAIGVINRKIDSDIITALETGTQDTGSAVTGSLALVMKAKVILGNAKVPRDGNISMLITPAFEGYLMQTKEFASADYINSKPFTNDMTMFRWAGINFIVHPELTGAGTSSETCIMYHKSAIGHAMNTEQMGVIAGYDEEQDYSFARCTGFFGSKLLQNTGVVLVAHDGSAFAAS